MQAAKLTSTSIVISSQRTGAQRLISSVTALHSSTDASISLNLWRKGLGRSSSAVHSAPMQMVMAIGSVVNCSAMAVMPTRPVPKRSPRWK